MKFITVHLIHMIKLFRLPVIFQNTLIFFKVKVIFCRCFYFWQQGPLEIALVFLCQGQESDEEGESQMITRHHHRLRLCFKEFIKR